MNRIRTQKKSAQFYVHDIMLFMAGALLIMTMLSVWMLSGMYAKYVVAGGSNNSAGVANMGVVVKLLEHEAYLKEGEYKLKNDDSAKNNPDKYNEVTENEYKKVIPGVDIPKDPFVRVTATDAEVDFELYIQVTESEGFPSDVTYKIDSTKWTPVGDGNDGIYKYNGYFDAGTYERTIYILENNTLYVSQYYDADTEYNSDTETHGQFSLSFKAWFKQVD